MKVRGFWAIVMILTAVGFLPMLDRAVSADVQPGEVIDKTNWQKLEGLVPESVLGWVKKGDFILQIEKLNFDSLAYFPAFQMKAFKENLGKYELDEESGIIDVKTGKLPKAIVGLPFPEIAPEDPKVCEKAIYNNHYMQYQPDNLRFPYEGINIGRGGFERESESVWYQMAMDGNPWAAKRSNPHGIEKYAITVVKKPYDVAGTAIMLWRYRAPDKEDTTFGYIPAIRRVRRMSAANRSDAFMGSDLAMDDANGYDGKVTAFTWKLLRKQVAIVAYLSADPVRVVQNDMEEWETTPGIRAILFGYQKKDWQGAPWAPTNLVWVKRPILVMEMTPKDSYYNYGVDELWVDAEKYGVMYKVINDKAGDYWKTFYTSSMVCASSDDKVRFNSLGGQYSLDDRRQHSTIIEDASPRNIWTFYAVMDAHDFTLGGFQKFCK